MKQVFPTTPLLDATERFRDLFSPWESAHEASKIRRFESTHDLDDRLQQARRDRASAFEKRVYASIKKTGRKYPNARRIMLPLCPDANDPPFRETVNSRRSIREFSSDRISLEELSILLRCTNGVTHLNGDIGDDQLLRAAPSAGGIQALELYVFVERVESVSPGIYYYDAYGHWLAEVEECSAIERLSIATVMPEIIGNAAIVFLFSAVIDRLTWKYGQRAYRLVLQSTGHSAQNLELTATSLGLGTCSVGGFFDDGVSAEIGVDGVTEFPVHLVAAGKIPVKQVLIPNYITNTSSIRVLRRLDGMIESHEKVPREWQHLNRRFREVFGLIAKGLIERAREALIALAALLPRDETLRDYMRILDHIGNFSLLVTSNALFAFDSALTDAERSDWVVAVDGAVDRAMSWLSIREAPSVFVDLTCRSKDATTWNHHRWIQRKVTFETGKPDEEVVAHEIFHTFYLPHVRLLAEGLAVVASASRHDLVGMRQSLATLPERPFALRDALDVTVLQDQRVAARGIARTPFFYPYAATFVDYLITRYGNERVLSFTDTLIYPAPASILARVPENFEDAIGLSIEEIEAMYWKELRE